MAFDLKLIVSDPATIEEAVKRLIFILTDRDKEKIKTLSRSELIWLHIRLGPTIRNGFGLNEGNIELLLDCNTIDKKACSMRIVEKVWENLKYSCIS